MTMLVEICMWARNKKTMNFLGVALIKHIHSYVHTYSYVVIIGVQKRNPLITHKSKG